MKSAQEMRAIANAVPVKNLMDELMQKIEYQASNGQVSLGVKVDAFAYEMDHVCVAVKEMEQLGYEVHWEKVVGPVSSSYKFDIFWG